MQKVSVILCHHKGQFVIDCIQSIKSSKHVEPEIIVVTSNPSIIEKNPVMKGVKLVYSNHGPSQKRNIGARYASSPYYFFLDDDTVLDPYFLFEGTKAFLENPQVGMIYGKSLNMERRNVLDNAGSYLTWTGFLYAREESGIYDEGQFEKPEYIFAGKGAAMAIRRSTYGKVRGFDPVYEILAEETDISWKVWLIGEKVMWVPKAVLYHAFNTKFKPWSYYYTNKRVFYNGSRNYIILWLKLAEWGTIARVLPILGVSWFIAGIGMILSGKFAAGWNILKGLLYHPFHWKDTMARRREAQRLRVLSDKELLPKIMRNPSAMFFIKRLFVYWKEGRHG